MIEVSPHGNLPSLDEILQMDLTEYQPRGGTMSFVGSPSMPEGPQREPDLEAAIRRARAALRAAERGDRKPGGAVAPLQDALAELVAAAEADQRVFPRMRPVR